MVDLEKDLQDPLKAKILNDIKELTYMENYNKQVDFPELMGETDPGWLKFSTENYESMAYRLRKKGARYEAFKEGDLEKYFADVSTNPEFADEIFKSSAAVAFQGDKIHLL
jgi:hypothetical protein